jgi:minor extracellular serine protease Vpr
VHRKVLPVAASIVVLLAATLPLATAAVEPHRSPATRFHRLDVRGVDPHLLPAMLTPARQVTVMLQLVADPVSVRQAKSPSRLTTLQRSSIRSAVKVSQDRIVPSIRAVGGRVIAQLQDAYDGIQVRAPAAALARLARLPGVTAVRSVQVFHRSNTVAVPYIGAPQAWSATKTTGKGVVIADIDTGLDFYHADFGGSGSVADYTFGAAHDTTSPAFDADGTTVAFPTAKVPRGFDFVGDDYDADPTATTFQPIPHPDPNPLDCGIADGGDGHGSHTAGTAAGDGVLSNGSTFSGPYDGTTYSGHTFRVGPGVAPQATIYAYRVFGCVGSTDVVAAAIDRAVKDGANVINLSLGTDFGRVDDPTTVAADNAAAAGTVVVSSSGNAGPGAYVTGSPAAGNRVLSVAALDAEFASYPSAVVDLGPDGTVDGINANDGVPLPVTGTLRVLMSGGDIALGCDDADYASVAAGDIVVTQRGDCDRVTRAEFGQAHGAAAVIMVNDSSDLPPFEGTIPGVTIPFIGVDLDAAAALVAADGTTVTVSPGVAPIANPTYRSVADFSSAGPRNGDSAPKPDVTAPGVAMTSAGVGTGSDGEVLSGTSMASPMGAGTAALVKAAHPTWTVDRIKAAIMNTATIASSTIVGYEVRAAGAGVINAGRAVSTVGQATTADHLDSLAFGFRALSGSFVEKKTFTLWNSGTSAIAYDLAASYIGDRRGTSVALSPRSVTVAAGGHQTVTATLSIGAAAVAALDDADIFSSADQGPGVVITVQGAVTATPRTSRAGVYPLRVPFVFVPRGLSAVTAAPRAPFVPVGDPGLLGSPIHPQPPARGLVTSSSALHDGGIHESTADVYMWGLSDPSDAPGTVDIRAAGVQSLPGPLFQASDDDRGLIFAVNTWHGWSTPVSTEFDIGIDTDHDGTDDFVVVGIDVGALTTGQADGQMASFTFDTAGDVIDAWIADAPMNSSVVELPTLASDLGLSASAPAFDYDLTGFSNETGAVDAVAGAAHVDAFDPLISNGDFIPLDAGASDVLPLEADLTRLSVLPPHASQPLGWMVVALDDAAGAAQADLVPLDRGH